MVMFTNWLMIGLIIKIKFHFRLKKTTVCKWEYCCCLCIIGPAQRERVRRAGYENSLPL